MKARFLSYYLLLLVSASAVLLTGCEETPSIQQVAVVKVDKITYNSAECEISINLNGSSKITERGITYDTKDWGEQKVVKATDAGDGTFIVKLEGLLSGAVYGVRGYAKNSEGVVYSSVVQFGTPLSYSTMKDDEGNEYETVLIGKQEWMIENLRSTKFNDGTSITKPANATAWKNANKGAYCVYTNLDENEYGYLYNGYAALRVSDDNSSLLPPKEGGWRVPTIDDWTTFQEHLIKHGYSILDTDPECVGKTLASNTAWTLSSEEGTVGFDLESNNSTKFNALPGGYRSNTGTFGDKGKGAYYWSSTKIPNTVGVVESLYYFATLSYDSGKLILDSPKFNEKNSGYFREGGFSIRLVRDVK